MSRERLRVLLVTTDLSKARTIGESLNNGAGPRFEIIHVQWFSAAVTRIESEPFDVVLLSLSLLDRGGLDAVSAVHDLNIDVPLIVLVPAQEQNLSIEAINRGADDCFIIEMLGGQSLRQMVSNAIERRKFLAQIRESSVEDRITGLYNRQGFGSVAQKYLQLCNRSKSKLTLLLAAAEGLASLNDENRNAEISRVAEILKRSAAKVTAISRRELARTAEDEFVIMVSTTSPEGVTDFVKDVDTNLATLRRDGTFPLSLRWGSATYDPEYPSSPECLLDQARSNLPVS